MPQERDPDLEAEWEARLAEEGLRPEPPVKRLRVRSKDKDRVKGRDPQPRREVSYDDWSSSSRLWQGLSEMPESELEAMMVSLPGEEVDSMESQSVRVQMYWDALEAEGPIFVLACEMLANGDGPKAIGNRLGLDQVQTQEVIGHVRSIVRRESERLSGGGG